MFTKARVCYNPQVSWQYAFKKHMTKISTHMTEDD